MGALFSSSSTSETESFDYSNNYYNSNSCCTQPNANDEEHKNYGGGDDYLIDEDEQVSQQMARAAGASINKDPSLPNVLSNFADLLGKPNLLSFEGLVSASKENWGTILQTLNKLSAANQIDSARVKAIGDIYNNYWSLLLRTQLGIEVLIKKCKLQRRNVAMLLKIIHECQEIARQEYIKQSNNAVSSNDHEIKGSPLSNDHERARQECIQQLGNWLKTGELDALIKEWMDMHAQLDKEHKEWTEIAKKNESRRANNNSNARNRRGIWSSVTSAFARVMQVCFGVQLTMLKCGGASTEMVDAAPTELELTVVNVQNKLSKMLKRAKTMGFELNNTKCAFHIEDDYKLFRNAGSLLRMEDSLEAIDEYLDDYISQGKVVVKAVGEACQEMINC